MSGLPSIMHNMENSDTTHCFLDGSPKQMGFYDRNQANKIHWPDFDVNPYKFDSDNNTEEYNNLIRI